MSKVEELLKDNKLTEKLSMAKLNDLLKKEEEEKIIPEEEVLLKISDIIDDKGNIK